MYRFRHRILLSLFWINFLSTPTLFSQVAKPELVYACENCVLTSYSPIGNEYKVLIYASNNKPMKRHMYLLDKSNLIVDDMKIDAASTLVKVNDSIFSLLDVSYAIMIKVKEKELVVEEAYEFYNGPKHGINTPRYIYEPRVHYWIRAKRLQRRGAVVFN